MQSTASDLVTQIDLAVEGLIREQIDKNYPGLDFYGEESALPGTQISRRPTFVVDPIDGTTNFVHGLPDVCVSLALVIDREPCVGVVYNPFLRVQFSAVRGQGAMMTTFAQDGAIERVEQLPVRQSPLAGLDTTIVGIEWGSVRDGRGFDFNMAVFSRLTRSHATGGHNVRAIRAAGSAAMSICRTAAGQQDMFWECGCWAWDVAAAWCVLVEAGGRMVSGQADDWPPQIDGRKYLAVRPASSGQDELIQEFWSALRSCEPKSGPATA